MNPPDHPRRDQAANPARPATPSAADPGRHTAASTSPDSGESRYRRVPAGQDPDPPFNIRIEFVVLDGPAGQELALRQARIMRKVLRWIAEHPDPADPETT
jgi:hypothetical protein